MSAPAETRAARPQTGKPRPEWGSFIESRPKGSTFFVSGKDKDDDRLYPAVSIGREGVFVDQLPKGARVILLAESIPMLYGYPEMRLQVSESGVPESTTGDYRLATHVRTVAKITIPQVQDAPDYEEPKPSMTVREVARIPSLYPFHFGRKPSDYFFVDQHQGIFEESIVREGMKIPGTDMVAAEVLIVGPEEFPIADPGKVQPQFISGMEVLRIVEGDLTSLADHFDEKRNELGGFATSDQIRTEGLVIEKIPYLEDEVAYPQSSSPRRAA